MKINLVNTTDKPEISNLLYFTLWMHISTIREHFPFPIQKKNNKKITTSIFSLCVWSRDSVLVFNIAHNPASDCFTHLA